MQPDNPHDRSAPSLRIGTHADGGIILLQICENGARLNWCMTPNDARMVAADLMAAAVEIDDGRGIN